MDILPIRKIYISPYDIKLSGENMVKPKGTTGATKMKIMAVIDRAFDSCEYVAGFYKARVNADPRRVFHVPVRDQR